MPYQRVCMQTDASVANLMQRYKIILNKANLFANIFQILAILLHIRWK